MTINDLIARLEDYRDDLGGDAEVRLMTQENWPFENEIVGLASGEEINEPDDGEDEDGKSAKDYSNADSFFNLPDDDDDEDSDK